MCPNRDDSLRVSGHREANRMKRARASARSDHDRAVGGEPRSNGRQGGPFHDRAHRSGSRARAARPRSRTRRYRNPRAHANHEQSDSCERSESARVSPGRRWTHRVRTGRRDRLCGQPERQRPCGEERCANDERSTPELVHPLLDDAESGRPQHEDEIMPGRRTCQHQGPTHGDAGKTVFCALPECVAVGGEAQGPKHDRSVTEPVPALANWKGHPQNCKHSDRRRHASVAQGRKTAKRENRAPCNRPHDGVAAVERAPPPPTRDTNGRRHRALGPEWSAASSPRPLRATSSRLPGA